MLKSEMSLRFLPYNVYIVGHGTSSPFLITSKCTTGSIQCKGLYQSLDIDFWREAHAIEVARPEKLFHHFGDGIEEML